MKQYHDTDRQGHSKNGQQPTNAMQRLYAGGFGQVAAQARKNAFARVLTPDQTKEMKEHRERMQDVINGTDH